MRDANELYAFAEPPDSDDTWSERGCGDRRTLPLEMTAYCAYCELSTPPCESLEGWGDCPDLPTSHREFDCVTRSTSELHPLLCESTSMKVAPPVCDGRELSVGVDEGTGNLTLLAELSALHAVSSMTILSDCGLSALRGDTLLVLDSSTRSCDDWHRSTEWCCDVVAPPGVTRTLLLPQACLSELALTRLSGGDDCDNMGAATWRYFGERACRESSW